MKIELLKELSKVVAIDNNNKIGECQFIISDNICNIVHTYVNEKYRGKGIAQQLVDCVIKEALKDNKKIKADCSYAKKILEKRM